MIKKLNKTDDFKEVIKTGKWLVDFSATWCGSCRMLEPVLEELGTSYNILKVDVDEFQELAQEFVVMSVPTLILFNDGQKINQTIGFIPKDALEKFINN